MADALGGWLIGRLADAGRRKLTAALLGTDQERALRSAAATAVQLTADELHPDDDKQAESVALVINQVFSQPVPEAPSSDYQTVLQALQAGIAGQLAVLDDASLTETGQSSADVLGIAGSVLAEKLTSHLLREIVVRGTRGGPLFPLASQLNDDVTHLQGKLIDSTLRQILKGMARLEGARIATAAPTARTQLPPPAVAFTGRDDELEVLARLLEPAGSADAVVVSAVAGLAGVGKTALAVQAGHTALKEGWFGGGVLFIDLHGYEDEPVQPSQALGALLRALSVPAQNIPPEVEERAALYRSRLAQIREPVLVIADNASSEAQIRPLLPGTGRHKVLVTSRNTLAGLDARLVDVTVLDEATGIKFLEAALRASRPNDDRISAAPGTAARLARTCGGLPLALQITAAILKADPVLTTGEVADHLSDEEERLQALRYDDGSGASGLAVAAAFELSYRRLDDMSARVFRLLPVAPGPDVSSAAVMVMAGLPSGNARMVLARLAQAHLVEPAPHGTGRWRMHDLVRMYAQRLSNDHAQADSRAQAEDRLLNYYVRMAQAADLLLRGFPMPEVPSVFAGRAQALAWFDAERTSLVAAVTMAAKLGQTQTAFDLSIFMAEYLDWRRQFDDKLATCAIGRDAARHLGDKVREAMALNGMGIALRETGQLEEAIAAHQDAVAVFREHGCRQYEGLALLNLGNALVEKGRYEEAITPQQNAATVFAEIGDRTGEGMAMLNLGIALHSAGRLEEAIAVEQDMAATFRETGDRHREAMALNNLGHALRKAERLEEAITAHQDASALFHETGDRHGDADALHSLAVMLWETGRFQEAITMYRDVAALFHQTGDRNEEGKAMVSLGIALGEMGRFEEAIAAHQSAVIIYREIGDRTGEGKAMVSLGIALGEMGRFEEAIAAHQSAVAIYRDIGDRTGEATALNNLGATLVGGQRFEQAITVCQDAVGIFRQIGDRTGEAIALDSLGMALRG